MITAIHRPARSGVQTVFDTFDITGVQRAITTHLRYRETLAALRKLDIRQLEDVGYAGCDLAEVARAATYGH